jgi:hypothetical protein
MNDFYRPFIPGYQVKSQYPLARFTPPLPSGMISTWLKQEVSPGSWVLDPFGSSSSLVLEAALAGYRVLTTINNPILSFMLEFLASAPKIPEFQAALASLAKERHEKERLETHLESLYLTKCTVCGAAVPVTAYLWRRDEDKPFARLFKCTQCGFEGELPVAEFDLEHLNHIGSDSLHRARALQRLGLENDQAQTIAKEALRSYLNRPLYVIFTLLNRMENASLPDRQRQCLLALLLQVCDEGNSLWPYPVNRSRPRSLNISPVFRENNLWRVFTTSMQNWALIPNEIPFTHWPEDLPDTGGICLFPGRLRQLFPLQNTIPFQAAVSIIPRPSQAFWTLSAMWSGWFWGPKAVLPLKSAFQRRRYDWNWHTSALRSSMVVLNRHLPDHLKYFTIVPELEPGLLTANFVAFKTSGFQIEGTAFRPETNLAQILWRCQTDKSLSPKESFEDLCRASILEFLKRRNEPASYLQLLIQCMTTVVNKNALPLQGRPSAIQLNKEIHSSLDHLFTIPKFLKRQEKHSENIETGLWWLDQEDESFELTLSDQVEMEIINHLQKKPESTFQELDENICQLFPGLLTPPAYLVQACLDSYAESSGIDPVLWSLRNKETPILRWEDIQTSKEQIMKLGAQMGFQTSGDSPLVWANEPGKPQYLFFITASGIISHFVFQKQVLPPSQCIIVFPGSRSILLTLKIQKDPHLAESVRQGWHFLKFRHLQRLANREEINPKLWLELLDTDTPRLEESSQKVFF